MGISLVTFAGQTVTPQDDALIYESALASSGLIYGGEVTIKSANTLHVAAAHGALCGRKFTIEETDIPVNLTASGSLLGRIYIHMDLSDADEPISFQVETAASLTPVIQQTNVNINNGVYEINLATFTVDTSTIDNLVDVRPFITSAEALKALIDANTEGLAKAYKKDDSTANRIEEEDYIPFYDTSADAMKKISKANANFGGGAGSFFVITTNESTLHGKTVSITDGVLVWQSAFDDTGKAQISGVTSIGELTITSTDGDETAETKTVVKTYSQYNIKLNFYTLYGFKVDATQATGNVSYNVQYNGVDVENKAYTPGYMDFASDAWQWGSWDGNEFFMPRPVLISQDYSDKIYLNPDNLTKDEDGNDVSAMLTGATDGYNAMMEWGRNGKRIWYKLVPDISDDATYTCYICDKQLDSGFKAWSFYDANNVLGEHFYTSIYNGSVVSNTLRSLSGKAPNNTTAGATQITYAKANNKNGESYAWYIDTFADRILINLLLILVTKSTNSDVVGYGNYTGGSSASNLINSGLGNTKGMFYGKQSNGVVKVFGMENYFANCWRRMAGLILSSGVELYKLTYGTADGSSSAGYREDDNAPSNYLTGKTIATNLSSSYISKESAKADGALLASAFGGTNGNYYSDACWSSTGVKYALVGGSCYDGSAVGAFALYLNCALSYSVWARGAALSLKPLAE